MKVSFTCKYCGNKWDYYMYDFPPPRKYPCPKCGDRDIAMTGEGDEDKVDYYKYDPIGFDKGGGGSSDA